MKGSQSHRLQAAASVTRRSLVRWECAGLGLVLLLAGVVLLFYARSGTEMETAVASAKPGLIKSSQPATPAAPCPATPVSATPTSSPTPIGSPEPDATACLTATPVVGLETPAIQADLSVTVFADRGAAGPVDLTVEVTDAAGHPVTDATVTIETEHLEMNHGVSINETVLVDPGRYLAENVAMGMGGTWQATIIVERPGQDQVVFTVLVRLEGPH